MARLRVGLPLRGGRGSRKHTMKHFFLPLLEPVGAVWALMCLGLCWLALRKQWRMAAWVGLPTALLFLLGSAPVAEGLVARAEAEWADVGGLKAEADAVVVLGGGAGVSSKDLYGLALNSGASRVLTGVELVRLRKGKNLVLGGSVPVAGNTGALVMERVRAWIDAWQLVHVPMITLGACRNTHDEAVAFGRLTRERHWKEAALVTSALHMRRSAAVFRKQGIEVTPVACDFQAYGVTPIPLSIFPRQERFRLLSLYVHEKVGYWLYWARGWL